jgi:ABC-type transport system involved in multi-copper enzyme maturation permease subunit
MGSTDSTLTLDQRIMPLRAILLHELRTLARGWLVRLWVLASLVVSVLLASAARETPTAPLVAQLLFPFLVLPWFLVVMVLGVTPVSGARVEELADGILSRPVTRYEYLLGSWAARVALVLGVYLIVTIPAILLVTLANRPAPTDAVTFYGIIAATSLVGLVLTFQVSLGFLFGTVLRNTLAAVVVLVFLWYPINLVLNVFSLEAFSPISLNQAIPTLLRQPWRESDQATQDIDISAEIEALARQAALLYGSWSGNPTPQQRPEPDFFNRDHYQDFSLPWVALGYGIPTLAAIALAVMCFCRRDL